MSWISPGIPSPCQGERREGIPGAKHLGGGETGRAMTEFRVLAGPGGQRQLDAQRKPHQDQESGFPSRLCPSATGSSGTSDLQLPGSFFYSTVKWE